MIEKSVAPWKLECFYLHIWVLNFLYKTFSFPNVSKDPFPIKHSIPTKSDVAPRQQEILRLRIHLCQPIYRKTCSLSKLIAPLWVQSIFSVCGGIVGKNTEQSIYILFYKKSLSPNWKQGIYFLEQKGSVLLFLEYLSEYLYAMWMSINEHNTLSKVLFSLWNNSLTWLGKKSS